MTAAPLVGDTMYLINRAGEAALPQTIARIYGSLGRSDAFWVEGADNHRYMVIRYPEGDGPRPAWVEVPNPHETHC